MPPQQRQSLATTERSRLSTSDFQKEIMRLSDASEESKNILVYGDSNAGKTVLAGTLPPKTFWAVCEPGYKTAVRWRRAQGLPPHKGARRISNSAEAWALIEWLEEKDRYRQLDWLVLDGVSTMQDRFRLAYTQEAFDLKGNRAHRNLPDKPDYFNTQNMLKSWFPRLIDMGVNLLVTAHAYRMTRDEDGEFVVFPGFQGKGTEVSNAISGLMDVTAYMESRRLRNPNTGATKIDRRLWFAPPAGRRKEDAEDTRYIVGDKFMALGEYMKDPTMPEIIAKIDGEETDSA